MVVGVLRMTNSEFRHLMSQSVRHMQDLVNQTIDFDLGAQSVNLRIVLGIVQQFPVDLTSLFRGYQPEQRVVAVSYTNLMMVVLKASLRSAFLKTSLRT